MNLISRISLRALIAFPNIITGLFCSHQFYPPPLPPPSRNQKELFFMYYETSMWLFAQDNSIFFSSNFKSKYFFRLWPSEPIFLPKGSFGCPWPLVDQKRDVFAFTSVKRFRTPLRRRQPRSQGPLPLSRKEERWSWERGCVKGFSSVSSVSRPSVHWLVPLLEK